MPAPCSRYGKDAHAARGALRSAKTLIAAGGRLHGYWYAFGDADGFVLFEAPDDVMTAGLLVKVASTGAFRNVSTTKLLTVEEALDALRQGGGIEYRAQAHPVADTGFAR
jgi:uncharacterized protein with GYD domain